MSNVPRCTSKTVPATSGSGKLAKTPKKAKVYRCGVTEVSTRATGRQEKPTSSVDCSIKMATFIKVVGKMIKPMASVTIKIKMVVYTVASG